MLSRINGDDTRLSTTEYLYVDYGGYADWVITLTHAYEITRLPMFAGNFYPDEEINLSLLKTPFTNNFPYNTDLLSVKTSSSPDYPAYLPGKYRAYKWLSYDDQDVERSLNLERNSLFTGTFDTYNIYANSPSPILRGLTLSSGIMASVFDAWPGKYSYDSYNLMWTNFFECAVGGCCPEYNRQAAMIQPPLYNPSLEVLPNIIASFNDMWEFAEINSKVEEFYNIISEDLKYKNTPWLGGCALAVYNWGSDLFHYSQLGYSDSIIRGGLILPLLRFVDFFFDRSNARQKLDEVVESVMPNVGDFTTEIKCPHLLSASMLTDISTPYPPWVGAGVDQNGWLVYKRDNFTSYNPRDFKVNPKLMYANYVSLCDLYRTFCTTSKSGIRYHNRWASVNNIWNIKKEVEIEREVRHVSNGIVTNVDIYGDRAEVDISYSDEGYVWKNLSTEIQVDDNTIIVARNQAYDQTDDGDTMSFVLSAKMNMTSCFVTSPDLRPNPTLPQETLDWIDRLFPDDPEDKRQQDLDDLEEKYEEEKDKLELDLLDLTTQRDLADEDYTTELYNTEIDIIKDVFPHYGYSIPQPIPHFPPYPLDYDYFEEWLSPGIIDATNNDPTLPTEDKKVERQELMWLYVSDIEDELWSQGGRLKAVEDYWIPIIRDLESLIKDKENEISRLTVKYWEDRDEIESEIYHPELPSQQDIDRLSSYLSAYGSISTVGQGTASITTVGRSKVIAPLSGYMTREYTVLGYGQYGLSDNSLFWPAPAIMMGPEKDWIEVEEYLPYKMMVYRGDLSDVNVMYDISSTIWSSYVGYDSGIGYQDMMTNNKRNLNMRQILTGYNPRYWTSPYGNIISYQGTIPSIPDLPSHTEHLTINFHSPEVIITVEENLDPRTLKQKTVMFTGEKRSNLKVSINGRTLEMSDLATLIIDLGSNIVGLVSLSPDRIDPTLLKFWSDGTNSEYYKYQQCDFYLRNAKFVLH